MRLVVMADTHLFHEDLTEIPEGDVLIHAGDACRGGSLAELTKACAMLRALPHRHKIFVAGNHDKALQDRPAEARALFAPDIHYLEDEGLTLDGIRLWGSPWTPVFHNWAFMLPRGAALAAKWALIPEHTDVLITHGPPKGFGDVAGDGRGTGCADLLARVREVKPLLHVYGHIHQGRGTWTEAGVTFVNATTWECELPPVVIDMDTSTRRVSVR